MSKRGARKSRAAVLKPIEPPSRWQNWAWMGGLVLGVIVTFSRLFSADFTSWDDLLTLKENPWFNPPALAGLSSAWTTPYMDLWVPVTYSVWWATAQVAWGIDPQTGQGALSGGTFHGLNVLLHAGSACIAFVLLRRLKFSPISAGIGAAIFALHPVQVESVGWTSGTKDVLFGCLSLATLAFYLKAVDPAGKKDTRLELGPYVASCIVLVCAVMSKPTAVVVPAIAFVLDWLVLGRPVKRAAISAAPLFLLMIPFAIVAKVVQPVPVERGYVLLAYRPLVAADAVAFYLGKLLAPIDLCPDYGRAPAKALASRELYWTWIFPLFVAAAVAWSWVAKKARMPAIAFAVFLIGMGPVLGFVRFDFQDISTVADHYLYLPMFGVALLVAWILSILPGRGRMVGIAVLGAILLALAARGASINPAIGKTLAHFGDIPSMQIPIVGRPPTRLRHWKSMKVNRSKPFRLLRRRMHFDRLTSTSGVRWRLATA